jgi:HSP20 family protein
MLVKLNHQAPKQLNDWFSLLNEDIFDGRFTAFPPVNIVENKADYAIEVAAPGLEKSEFKVQLDRNLLTISVDKKETVEDKEGRSVRKEFSHRAFKRSFTLDDKIDAAGIVARYENGILKLTLPKKEEVKESSKDIAVL